jgi:signal transduction histidine kinase/CheY-like chemotaxis protein
LVESQGQWGQEYRFQTRDGKVTWVYGLAAPQHDASGKITQYVGINIDITDHKLAEEEQAKLQDQLTQAQKMESVGRLAGGVAHDFNNLLMGTMGYTQLCLDELGPDHPIRKYLDEIMSGTERSAELSRQLLAFARKQIIAPKVLDLSEAVSSMLKLLQRLIGEDIAMKFTAHSDTWPVKMDPVQIDQILANLCVNARDAIGGVGSITIETSNATFDEAYCAGNAGSVPGDYALLTVTDTGCGMVPETLEHIFEPFFTTKGVGEGTGLGLATVFGIVKQNNGYITVYSEPGKGTTFKIYLPRHVLAETAQAAASAPAKPPRGTETILMVEDEKSVRVTTHMFLEDLGYTVLVAENPEKALALAAQHPGEMHLLITDVIMPGMSGRDLAKRLLELRPTLKRLFISGFTADVIAQRGILDDGVNFMSKPFGRDALARKVREVLEDGERTRTQ